MRIHVYPTFKEADDGLYPLINEDVRAYSSSNGIPSTHRLRHVIDLFAIQEKWQTAYSFSQGILGLPDEVCDEQFPDIGTLVAHAGMEHLGILRSFAQQEHPFSVEPFLYTVEEPFRFRLRHLIGMYALGGLSLFSEVEHSTRPQLLTLVKKGIKELPEYLAEVRHGTVVRGLHPDEREEFEFIFTSMSENF